MDNESIPEKKRKQRAASKQRMLKGSKTAEATLYELLGEEELKLKNTFGRPTEYSPEYDQMLVQHMKDGNSFWSFAAKVNVCFETLQNWTKLHPTFMEARRIGEAYLLLFDELSGKAGMLGKLRGFNAKVWETIVRNRWRRFYYDRREIRLDFQKPNELASLSDDELTALIKEQLANTVDEHMSEVFEAAKKA